MYHPSPEELLSLLKKIDQHEIETYKNFPDILRAGTEALEKEEVEYLLDTGHLEIKRLDSFGKFLRLSERAKRLLKGMNGNPEENSPEVEKHITNY